MAAALGKPPARMAAAAPGGQAAAAAMGVPQTWPPLLGSDETILHICYFYVKNILDGKMTKKFWAQ